MDKDEYQARLSGEVVMDAEAGAPIGAAGRAEDAPEGFEVLAITAGEGNGWRFDAPVLRESLGLWDGVECFVDHAWRHRSVRDLAGVLLDPRWDEEREGIRCRLRVVGPSGPLLEAVGREMREKILTPRFAAAPPLPVDETKRGELAQEKTPRVGFSADVVFSAEGPVVTKILKVNSVDLVVYPARGGAFVGKMAEESSQLPVDSGQCTRLSTGHEKPHPPAPSPDRKNSGQKKGSQNEQNLPFSLLPSSSGHGFCPGEEGPGKVRRNENPPRSTNPEISSGFVKAMGRNSGQCSADSGRCEEEVVHEVFEMRNGGEAMTEKDVEGMKQDSGPVDGAEQARAQLCEYVLESGLAAARLPRPVAERVRKQFSGKAFEPAELNAAIDDARTMLSELTGPGVVQGVSSARASTGRISGMFSSEDQFSAAIHDLLGAERPEDLKGVRPARLSGIRELYTRMTGDVDFSGGYDGARAQFATSTDLPNVLKNAMNRLIFQEWQELGRSGYRWWEPVVAVEHFNNLQQITGVLVGEVNVLPQVNEGAAYTALGLTDSGETASWTKYGGYIGLTLEMFERDETHKLRQYPRKLASAGLRRISALVGSIFTANAGAGPLMADNANVFHNDHGNLGSAALSSAAWEAASQAIYGQSMLVKAGDTPPVLALDAKYLLVPRALRLTGANILYPSFAYEANIFSDNMQRGELGDVITVPEFSDPNDWAAVADPRLAPGIVVAERFGLLPEIILADNQAQGALFTNDEIRMKARHYLAVFVADYRPLWKGNVA